MMALGLAFGGTKRKKSRSNGRHEACVFVYLRDGHRKDACSIGKAFLLEWSWPLKLPIWVIDIGNEIHFSII